MLTQYEEGRTAWQRAMALEEKRRFKHTETAAGPCPSKKSDVQSVFSQIHLYYRCDFCQDHVLVEREVSNQRRRVGQHQHGIEPVLWHTDRQIPTAHRQEIAALRP